MSNKCIVYQTKIYVINTVAVEISQFFFVPRLLIETLDTIHSLNSNLAFNSNHKELICIPGHLDVGDMVKADEYAINGYF